MSPAVFEPLHDHVLVRPDPLHAAAAPAGSIVLQAGPATCRGTVLAVGPGRLVEYPSPFPGRLAARQPMSASAGDRVLFAAYAGTPVEVDGEPLRLLRDGELMARVG